MARSLDEWLEYIESIRASNWELGLDRIGSVADRLELRKPAPTSVIVAGTNGKGSTCVCLEQVLIASGLTVGCTLSPHVHVFNERVRVNGVEVDDAALCEAFEVVEAGRGDTLLTYFEFTSLAALYCFKQAGVDVAVLEIGLGGRLDAFNIVDGDIAVITNIGIDHTDWLGDTRELIGAEKAGVLRRGQRVMLGPDMPASVLEPATGLAGNCMQVGREIKYHDDPEGRWSLNLNGQALNDLPRGPFPIANCALALAAANAIHPVDVTAARAAIDRAWMPGRCEEIVRGGRRWVVDVAHNPLGAGYLRRELPRRYPDAGITAVLGTLADKDAEGILAALDDIVGRWILVDAPPPRGLTAAALAERLGRREFSVAGPVARGLEEAGSLAQPGDVILVFGSFATAETARLELTKSGDAVNCSEFPQERRVVRSP
ncbi:MAG: bifunctional tetrahydrofolate synthase/dihydrofolate synthase [Gammaproteobacteria bacterium]|nr:bifunctional tetrahydrofolate synthase/dihydrofolate synthase [Gammaproteobacteria bacterium]